MNFANENYLNLNQRRIFLRKFIESPSQIGSITPSSKFLAKKMVECVNWKSIRAIAELGAGTGIFTKYIADLKLPDCKVAVFEKDREMRSDLAVKYAEFNFFDDALFLTQSIRSAEIDSLDSVISSLPFALMTEDVREKIIDEVIASLKPSGTFVTFQFSLQMKSLLLKKFSGVEISFVPLNIPPAFIFVCYN